MKLKLCILLLLSGLFFSGFTQKLSLERTLNVSSKFVKVDELGDIYLYSNYNLYKLSKKGDTIAVYSTKRYGKITDVDVSIPQKPLIFYREPGLLLELDYTLSENAPPINLYQEGLANPVFAIHSPLNNGYWVYDQAKYELFHFDKQFNKTFSSGNILQQTSLNDFKPKNLIFHQNSVFLESENNGLLMFDLYGAFVKKIHLNGYDKLFVEGDALLLIKEKMLIVSDLNLALVINVPFEEDYTDVYIKKDKAYFLSTKGLKIFKVETDDTK